MPQHWRECTRALQVDESKHSSKKKKNTQGNTKMLSICMRLCAYHLGVYGLHSFVEHVVARDDMPFEREADLSLTTAAPVSCWSCYQAKWVCLCVYIYYLL